MKKLLILALLSLIMVACSQEEPVVVPDKPKSKSQSEHRVSLDDALKTADALLAQIGEPGTRSKPRRVESIEYMTNPSTRAAGGDTLLYLVNYSDDAGFALLAADNRLRPVYAISDEGSMSFADTTYNKGLSMFANVVDVDVAYTLNRVSSTPELIDTFVPETRVVRRISPLLNYFQRRWNQTSPYNQYCFTKDGHPAYVGCAAVAVGMIMSYYKHPTSYGGYTFDWTSMNDGENNENIARFLSLLGDENNLQMNYGAVGVNGSGALRARYYPTFTNMGYIGHEELKDFSEEEICAILDKSETALAINPSGPVLVRGTSSDSGHGWVIDGYVQYERLSQSVGSQYVLEDILFHCVWGWGGSSNGYFYWATNESFGGVPKKLDGNDDSWEDTDYVFDFDLKYMGNFRKVYKVIVKPGIL